MLHLCYRVIEYTLESNLNCREYKVEVRDRSFNPPIMVIEEGDRIWWFWDKNKVSVQYRCICLKVTAMHSW